MKKIKYCLFVGLLLGMIACDDNIPQSFNKDDAYASFPVSAINVNENTLDVLHVPVALAGFQGGSGVNVFVEVSTAGISNPAIEGVDFTIASRSVSFTSGTEIGYVDITVIDNDQFEGKKSFYLVIANTTPNLKPTIQDKVLITIQDDEHPWAILLGEYDIVGFSLFDGEPYEESIFIEPSDEDVSILNVDFGEDNPAKMQVEEIDGEIVVSIKSNQYLGPEPRPTDQWLSYFVATNYLEEEDDVEIQGALGGVFEDGVITCEFGFGIEAIHPVSGASGGFFLLSMDGVKFVKK